MENLVFTQLSITEVRQLFREELENYFATQKQVNELQSENDIIDEVEASEYLSVSRMTLKKWRDEGRIKFYRMGKKIRYRKSDLLKSFEASNK